MSAIVDKIVAFLAFASVTFLASCITHQDALISDADLAFPLPNSFVLIRENTGPAEGLGPFFGTRHAHGYVVNGASLIRFQAFGNQGRHWMEHRALQPENGATGHVSFALTIRDGFIELHHPGSVSEVNDYSAVVARLEDQWNTRDRDSMFFQIFDLEDQQQVIMAQSFLASGGGVEVPARFRSAVDIGRFLERDWQDMSLAESQRLIADNADVQGAVRTGRAVHFYSRPLSFYDGVRLIKVVREPGDLRGFYFLAHDGDFFQLDGRSPRIHEVNSRALRLSEADVSEYLWFFSFFVRGAEGPFLLLESNSDSYYPTALSQAEQQRVNGRLTPISCAAAQDGFRCSGTVYYGGALFEAQYEVEATGMISMVSDSPILTGLSQVIDAPLHLE